MWSMHSSALLSMQLTITTPGWYSPIASADSACLGAHGGVKDVAFVEGDVVHVLAEHGSGPAKCWQRWRAGSRLARATILQCRQAWCRHTCTSCQWTFRIRRTGWRVCRARMPRRRNIYVYIYIYILLAYEHIIHIAHTHTSTHLHTCT